MTPPNPDKPNQGAEKEIKSLDPAKAAADLARRELEVKQKTETKEVKQEEAKDKGKVVDDAAKARADLLTEKPSSPAKIDSSTNTPDPEYWRANEFMDRIGQSSICADLVEIIKKKAGLNPSGDSKVVFRGLCEDISLNMQKYDSAIAGRMLKKEISGFEAVTTIIGQLIAAEVNSASADKQPRLKEVANTFQVFVESVKKLPKPSDTQATPANQPSTAPGAQPAAATPEEPKGFFAGLMEKFKGFFAGISTAISGFFSKLFGKKDETPAPTATPVQPAPSPAPAPGVSPPSGPAPKIETGGKSEWRAVINSEAQRLGIDPAFAMAIVTVEAGKVGFGPGGAPIMRFESHVFNSQLSSRGVKEQHGFWGSSKLVGRNVDGVSCEGGQGSEQACFQKAVSINKEAAYNSISMGLGQIMGFNASGAGYSSAENMYQRFSASGGGEPEQIKAMFKLIENNPGHLKAARNRDFSSFARLYNGASVGSGKHAQYTSALQNAYRSNGGSAGGNMAVA